MDKHGILIGGNRIKFLYIAGKEKAPLIVGSLLSNTAQSETLSKQIIALKDSLRKTNEIVTTLFASIKQSKKLRRLYAQMYSPLYGPYQPRDAILASPDTFDYLRRLFKRHTDDFGAFTGIYYSSAR